MIRNHVPSRKVEDALFKKALALAVPKFLWNIVFVNPSVTEAVWGGGQTENADVRIVFSEFVDDLKILRFTLGADPVTLIDDEKGEVLKETRVGARDRLDTAEDHFLVTLFTVESCRVNTGFKTQRDKLRVVLLNEFSHMRHHQHSTFCDSRKLRNH